MWLGRPAYMIATALAVVIVGMCAMQQLTAAQPVEPILSSGVGSSAGAVRSARASQGMSAPSNHPVEPQAAWEVSLPAMAARGIQQDDIPALTTTPPGPLYELPSDPFQRCAVKALAGEFGPLKPWQERAYRWGLAQGVTVQGIATCTTYYEAEGHHRGDEMRSGIGVNERHAAVLQREWRQLQQYYVWVQPTLNRQGKWVGGIRQVMDTGSNRNHQRFAIEYGTDRWLDFWYPDPRELVFAPYCFITTHRARLIR